MNIDPLQRLVVSEEAIARDDLADALEPYVGITESGRVVLTARGAHLNAGERLLAVLLAVWAATLLGHRENAGVTPAELVTLSGLPPGTVRPKLSELRKKRLVTKDGTQYAIPLTAIRIAASAVSASKGGSRGRAE